MKRNKIIILSLAVMALVSCDPGKRQSPDVAALTAKAYYEQLLQGRYEDWVDAHYQPEKIPASYREQLIANAKMFVGQQKEEHHGIDSIRIASAQTDSVHHVSNVFLTFFYGDSIREDIVVPMIQVNGNWYVK